MTQFGDRVRITYVMSGMVRTVEDPLKLTSELCEASARSGMPVDPRLWIDRPPASTYPACQAVKAAADQGRDGAYLRVLREGFMLDRAKLDTADALIRAAGQVPGMDVARFEIDLRSSASVEALAEDLEHRRALGERHGFVANAPAFVVGDGGAAPLRPQNVWEYAPLERAVTAAGAEPLGEPEPTPEQALARFGRMTTAEVASVCGLPRPAAAAALWRLADDWRARPERVLAADVWQPAG